jgi:hypothetical protein
MLHQRSKRTEAEDTSRVDRLLRLLRDLSQRDPSPALRERLSDLASRRLSEKPVHSDRFRGARPKSLAWLRPVFVAILLIAIGFTAAVVVHLRQRESLRADNSVKIYPPARPSDTGIHHAPPSQPSEGGLPQTHHSRRDLAPRSGSRRMTMRLPYSNGVINTGTDATIRISMSQSELLSLGFPISSTLQDRRVVAELTLGDDGLPRAISLPLSLEYIKEKK